MMTHSILVSGEGVDFDALFHQSFVVANGNALLLQ